MDAEIFDRRDNRKHMIFNQPQNPVRNLDISFRHLTVTFGLNSGLLGFSFAGDLVKLTHS